MPLEARALIWLKIVIPRCCNSWRHEGAFVVAMGELAHQRNRAMSELSAVSFADVGTMTIA